MLYLHFADIVWIFLRPLLNRAAGAGVFRLAVFVLLTFSDILTRTDIPLR